VLVPDASTPVLEAADVGVRDRAPWLVRGLDLRLDARTVTWLVTLDPVARDATALALAGRLAVDEGHVHVVDPRDATRRSGRAVRRVVGIGWVPRLRLLEDRARVGEVVRQAHRRAGSRLDDETLDSLLTDAGLAGTVGQAADDLPASQKALLGLVAAVAGDPPVVVAPFPSGSAQDRDAMTAFTERLARDGSTVLVVTAGDFRPPDAGPATRVLGRPA
jgi:ABC-type ATPase involved in cell division